MNRSRSLRLHAVVALTVCAACSAARVHAQVGARVARFEVHEASLSDLQQAMASGRVTAVALVEAYLARIEAFDRAGPRLNAIVHLNPNARAEAAALDEERSRNGARGPLHGIPVLLKDNFDTADMPTTGASIALAGRIPSADAFQVRRLREAGAIILGKTNLHELAAGIVTVSSFGGQTRNPYDPRRNPGGSSGGTGAAIAASFAAIGWGTDTCGSIRIPAAHNALFGLRPTKGLSSVAGVIPLSHSQDVAGPLARTVADLAAGLDATSGEDPADPATSALRGRTLARFTDALRSDALHGARLGVLTPHFGDDADDAEAGDIVRAALDRMKQLGAEVVDVEIPGLTELIANTSLIDEEFRADLERYLAASPAAAVASLGDILDRGLYHAALEQTFRRRNESRTDSATSRDRRTRRAALHDSVRLVMDRERIDALVYPTSRRKPALIGEPQRGVNCQLSASTGMPALSAPAGFTADGLPIAIELLGRRFDDTKLVGFAHAYEQSARPRRPPRTTPPLGDQPAPRPLALEAGTAGLAASFTIDPYSDTIHFRIDVHGVSAERVYAIVLQRRGTARTGIVHRLAGPGTLQAQASFTLSPAARDDLIAGQLALAVYTADTPGAATLQAPVRLLNDLDVERL